MEFDFITKNQTMRFKISLGDMIPFDVVSAYFSCRFEM